MGWGLGKKYALKRKTKKQCRTIAVNDSELCTFSARIIIRYHSTLWRSPISMRIANRKYHNIYIIVFNRVIPMTEERELDRLSRCVGYKNLRYTSIDVSSVARKCGPGVILT